MRAETFAPGIVAGTQKALNEYLFSTISTATTTNKNNEINKLLILAYFVQNMVLF